MPTISIRAAAAADLPAVLALYRQLYPELDVQSDHRVTTAWATTIATPGRTVLVAEDSGTAVGTLDLTVLANAAHAGQPYALVENVVVDTRARRRGVGQALLHAAREHAEASGCYRLQLSAVDEAAFAFYEAAGLEAAARTYKRYLDPPS